MSLDIYLIVESDDYCSHCGRGKQEEYVFSGNITHNLGEMALGAGIYKAVWRPEECGPETAGQVAEVLRTGLRKMKDDPEHFREMDSPNGWGTYDYFIPWLERYLEACEEHPTARVVASR